jgi:extradiol dioxygenase family protein
MLTAITTAPTPLTAQDVKDIRRAKYAILDTHPAGLGSLRLIFDRDDCNDQHELHVAGRTIDYSGKGEVGTAHVPSAHFDAAWSTFARCLRPKDQLVVEMALHNNSPILREAGLSAHTASIHVLGYRFGKPMPPTFFHLAHGVTKTTTPGDFYGEVLDGAGNVHVRRFF